MAIKRRLCKKYSPLNAKISLKCNVKSLHLHALKSIANNYECEKNANQKKKEKKIKAPSIKEKRDK